MLRISYPDFGRVLWQVKHYGFVIINNLKSVWGQSCFFSGIKFRVLVDEDIPDKKRSPAPTKASKYRLSRLSQSFSAIGSQEFWQW